MSNGVEVPTWKKALEGGVELPMLTLPLASTVRKVDVAVPAVVEAMVNKGVLGGVLSELEIDKSE